MSTATPLRLSFVCHEFPPFGGGAATALDETSQALVARGHSVQVIAVGSDEDPPEDNADGREIVRIQAGRRHRLAPPRRELFRSYRALKRCTPEIIHSFSPDVLIAFMAVPAGRAVVPVARRFDIPFVISLRGSDVPGFRPSSIVSRSVVARTLISPVLDQAQLLITNGERLARLAAPWTSTPIHSIANGVAAGRFQTIRRPLGGREAPLRVVCVGQLIERKRPLLAIESVMRAIEAGVAIDLTIVGDGPLRPQVQRRLGQIAPPSSARLFGSVERSRLPDVYEQADALLHLSAAEGVSNVVMEGLAAGLALITVQPTIDEFAGEADDVAIVVEPAVESVSDALVALRGAPARLAALSERARRFAERRTWANVAREWEQLLTPLVRGRSEVSRHEGQQP